jgi:hypothetical protein
MATIAFWYFMGGTPVRLWYTDLRGHTCSLYFQPAFFRRMVR